MAAKKKSTTKGNPKHLVLVESPSKAKTINKYLGKEYKVLATVGHVIDLPKSKLAVDKENDFTPEWSMIKGKGKVVTEIKKNLPDENHEVFLAMDPDREGEAIAYHVAAKLGLKSPKRIVFNEITKSAVTNSIESPREIDDGLVHSQFARRVLDRLVGYELSQVLWQKMWYGLSGGRVQSPALRLIVEREQEIDAFDPQEYWEIFSNFEGFRAQLSKIEGKKAIVSDSKTAKSIEKACVGEKIEVDEIKTRKVSKSPSAPFTTSTLQQAANNRLGLSASRTMQLAQQLYQQGHITYMRTDSTNLSKQALDQSRKFIKDVYGDKYLPKSPRIYSKKSKNAQEAHEAVRPTNFSMTQADISEMMTSAHAKLYEMIKSRTVASQMENKQSEQLSVVLKVDGNDGVSYSYRMGGEKVLFDGFRRAWGGIDSEDKTAQFSSLKEGDTFKVEKLELDQLFTKPPARFNEASLVKMLEKLGIGRPSTYASIISVVIARGYVLKEGKQLVPTDVGKAVCGLLVKSFTRLVDYDYTANIEKSFDKIASQELEYVPFMKQEYGVFDGERNEAMDKVDKAEVVILEKDTDEKCEKCDAQMHVKLGRYGKFYTCSTFPDCDGIKSIDGGEENMDFEKYKKPSECPKCKAQMKLKVGKNGQFWGCEKYPECKGIVGLLLNKSCDLCKKDLVERRSRWGKMFNGCSGYPDCNFIEGAKNRGKRKATTKKKTAKKKATSRKKTATKKAPKKTSKSKTAKSKK